MTVPFYLSMLPIKVYHSLTKLNLFPRTSEIQNPPGKKKCLGHKFSMAQKSSTINFAVYFLFLTSRLELAKDSFYDFFQEASLSLESGMT